jgi:hypothetical protein
VERPCGGGGQETVHVRGPDAKFSTTVTTSEAVKDLDVRDDGYAVVWTDRGIYVVPPGTTSLTPQMLLRTDGCAASAPAWDNDVVVAWQPCAGRAWTLGRWSATGKQLSTSRPVEGMSSPLHTAVTDGLVLVSLDNYRIPRYSDGALIDTPNALRWKQADW